MAGNRRFSTVIRHLKMGERASADAIRRETPEQPIYAEITDQIQELIESGELGQGDQLLSERELAELFRVSRTSIRRALAVLAGRGIIEVSPRKGAYVRRPTAQDAMQPWIEALLRDQNQSSHLAEVRQIVEVQAARWAAERREAADIERLWALHLQVANQVREGYPADHSDTAFHVGIVESAKNPFLTELITVLAGAMIKEMGPTWSYVLSKDPAEAQRYITEHEQIVQAIADQNPDRASELMSAHIRRARQILVDNEHAGQV